jgi:ferric enterobactin receptor
MKIKTFILFFLFYCPFLFAQTAKSLSEIKVNQLYSGTLKSVFNQIGKENDLKFSILDGKISNIEINERPLNMPLDEFLDFIAKKKHIKWHAGEDGIIYFISTSDSQTLDYEQKNIHGLQEFPSKISGVIRDFLTGEALPFAAVSVKGGKGTSTNVDGYFTLQNIPKGTETLIVNYLGYKTREIKPSQISSDNNVIIEVEPADKQLEEVVVTATKEELMKVSSDDQISTIRLSPAKLATLPNIGERDIFRGFQLMPGVGGSNEASSGLYVRGGTPDQNLVIYDGFTIYHVDHLYGFFSAFNANAIKDVQLYKGGYDARYGGRLSSVVQLTGKEGNAKHFNVGGNLSLLSANVFAEIPIGDKFTSLVAFRRSYTGGIYSKIFNKFNTATQSTAQNQGFGGRGGGPGGINSRFASVSTTPKSYFYDLNSKFTYKPTKKDIISLSIFNGTDDLDNSTVITTPAQLVARGITFDNTTNDKTNYGNLGSSLKWSHRFNDKFYNNTLVSFSKYYSTRNRLSTIKITRNNGTPIELNTGFVQDNSLEDFSLRSDFEYKLNTSNDISFGLQLTQNRVKYDYTQNDTVKVLNRNNTGNLSVFYLQDNIKYKWLKITPGIRINQFSVTKKVYIEPRLNILVNVLEGLKFVAATGVYHQFAQRVEQEDILNGSSNFWLLPDGNNIPISSSNHFIAGLNYETKKYYFSVETYYKSLSNLTQYSLRVQARPSRGPDGGGQGGPAAGATGGTSTVLENFFVGNGSAKGVEFLVQKKAGAYNGWLSYTLSQALNNFAAFSTKDFPASQDVRNEFKMTHNYRWKKFDFSATWIYATGRPYTAPEGGYTIALPDGSTRSYNIIGAKNGKRLPDYHRLDVAATYNFKLFNGLPSTLSASVFNVYGRKNVWYKQFSIVDNQLVEVDVTNLGITPNITLSISLR